MKYLVALLLLCAGCIPAPIKRDLLLRWQTNLLTVQADPPTGGVVTASGNGPQKLIGDVVVIGATPFAGWRFVSWNDRNTNAIRYVTMPRDRDLQFVASFELESDHPSHPPHPPHP